MTVLRAYAPGLLLVGLLTALAYPLATLPGLKLMGPLVLALILGITFRAVLGLPGAVQKGGQFAAKSLLKVGIVLLGVRLNFLLLAEIGAVILVANLAVVIFGLLAMEWFGRKLNLPLSLRLGVAVGTCICGASATIAAVPIIGANDEEAGVSVAVTSLLGTFGVVLYTLFAAVLVPSETVYGTFVGATLQEVAQVIAAGYAVNTATGDLAILVKLARVALLAPALIGINLLLRRREETNVGPDVPPLLPLFLIGFLALGAAHTFGLVPAATVPHLTRLSLLLTAAAMVGVGLGVDLGAFKRAGTKAFTLGAVGYLLLIAIVLPYSLYFLK